MSTPPSPVVGAGKARAGSIAIVSQSGAFGAYAYALARARPGASCRPPHRQRGRYPGADCIAWLAADPATRVILAYLEGCRDGERLPPRWRWRARTASRWWRSGGTHRPGRPRRPPRTLLRWQATTPSTMRCSASTACGARTASKSSSASATRLGGAAAAQRQARAADRLRRRRRADGGRRRRRRRLDVAPMPEAAQRWLTERVPFAAPRNPVDVTGQVTSDPACSKPRSACWATAAMAACWFSSPPAGCRHRWRRCTRMAAALRAAWPDRLIVFSTLSHAAARRAGRAGLPQLRRARPRGARGGRAQPLPPPPGQRRRSARADTGAACAGAGARHAERGGLDGPAGRARPALRALPCRARCRCRRGRRRGARLPGGTQGAVARHPAQERYRRGSARLADAGAVRAACARLQDNLARHAPQAAREGFLVARMARAAASSASRRAPRPGAGAGGDVRPGRRQRRGVPWTSASAWRRSIAPARWR